MSSKTNYFTFALLFITLLPLEILCAFLAYETLGEIFSHLYLMGIILLHVPIIVLALRQPVVAAIGIVVLALLIIPYQVMLGHRLMQVQAETTQIVAYLYEQKAETGAYPANLSSYTFGDAALQTYIQRYQPGEMGKTFTVFYRVGTETTSHWYSSETGWGYYPD
jgi:hypothetical protein